MLFKDAHGRLKLFQNTEIIVALTKLSLTRMVVWTFHVLSLFLLCSFLELTFLPLMVGLNVVLLDPLMNPFELLFCNAKDV